MTYFGWPAAHEDDPERAARAGLEIIEAVKRVDSPEQLRVRVGIATGPVVVGETGRGDASVPKLAVGETPNLAARAQGLAGPDEIVVSESTHRLAGDIFAYQDLGEKSLKGIVDRVRCWRVLGLRQGKGRSEVPAAEGLTPFVGREHDLATLEDRLVEAERGQGQVVVLVGDPGVGKSRLLLEFHRRIAGRVTWIEGRAISYGQSMVFHPLIDLLRRNFRIEDGDDSEVVREKVTAGMAHVGADLEKAAPYVHYLLGAARENDPVLEMDPQIRRAELFGALRQLLLAAAERRPQVLVFEDLHWSDTATKEFLGYLLDSLPASRVLLLAALRSGYAPPFGGRSYVTRMSLQKLTPEDTMRVAEGVLSASRLPGELEALVQRKAEGNPFFIEELVKSLSESGAIRSEGDRWVLGRPLGQIVVPDTIQGVLMSRIDRLEEEPRSTLQLAAVIGREFTQRLLDRIADFRANTSESLRKLQAAELIHQKTVYPELAFMFKHALSQDVAYGSLLVQRRRDLHRRVAEAMEELYAERLSEYSAIIAYHFGCAENWSRAADYFAQAADHAASAFAIHEAIDLCGQAMDSLDRSDQTDADPRKVGLHEKRAGLCFLVSDFVGAHSEGKKAAEIADRMGDLARVGSTTAGMALASVFSHKFAQSLTESKQAIEIAQDVKSDQILAAAHFSLGFVQHVTGNVAEARKNHEQAYKLSDLTGDAFHKSLSSANLSEIDTWQGKYRRSAQRAREGLEIARSQNLVFPELVAVWSLSLPLIAQGDYDEGHAVLQDTLALAEKVGDEFMRFRALNTLGWLHSECGGTGRAIELNELARELSTGRGDPETIANAELNLGDAFLVQGDGKQAAEFFEHVHKLAGNPSTSEWMRWRYSQHLFVGYGETDLALGDLGKAEEWANQCLDLAKRTDSKKYLVRGSRLKADIAKARLHWEEAEEALLRAVRLAERLGNPTQLWKTHLALGRLYQETRRPDQARAATRSAKKVIDGVGSSLAMPELRNGFEASSLIRSACEECDLP